jgi:hypothetical protein
MCLFEAANPELGEGSERNGADSVYENHRSAGSDTALISKPYVQSPRSKVCLGNQTLDFGLWTLDFGPTRVA